MTIKDKTKATAKFAVRYLTPWPSIKRIAESVRGSVGRTMDRAREARQALVARKDRAEQAREQEMALGLPKNISPEDKFSAFYEAFGWDETGLRQNWISRRIGKWVWFCSVALCAAGVIGMIDSPSWLARLASLSLLVAAPVLAVRGALDAWQQTRIELRSMISFSQFASRGDFFRRLFA